MESDPETAYTVSTRDQQNTTFKMTQSFTSTTKKVKKTTTSMMLDEDLNRTKHTLHVNVFVNYVGKIDMVSQTFVVRFDVYLEWDLTGSESLPTVDKFKPVLRFPEAERWSRDIDDVEFTNDKSSGFRTSISGTFRSELDLRNFPFDIQGLKIEMMLGVNSRGKNAGDQLSIECGYSFGQHPERPNLCDSQIDTEYNFRPLRYYLSASSKIMSQALSIDGKKATKSKYVLVIPVERNSSFWLLNNYVFVLLCQILSFSTFALEMPKQAGDILGITLALYFLLVAYKFALMNGLPRLSYFTHFDSYLWLVFALLFVQYVLQTLLLWVKDPGDNFADEWNYLFYSCFGTSFFAHVVIIRKGWSLYKDQTRSMNKLGKIDRTAMKIYEQYGLKISEKKGTVKNIHRYRELLEEIDGIKTY